MLLLFCSLAAIIATKGHTLCLWTCLIHPAAADEWEQSIRESHPQSDETDAALATHRAEVERIRAALQKYSTPIHQLIEASETVARATCVGSTAAAVAAPDDQQLQQAVGVLRQAAAHVSWF
jgi:hypothetical protein